MSPTAATWASGTDDHQAPEPALPLPRDDRSSYPSPSSPWSADYEARTPAAYDTPTETPAQVAQPPTAQVPVPAGNGQPIMAFGPVARIPVARIPPDDVTDQDVTDQTELLPHGTNGPARSARHAATAEPSPARGRGAGAMKLVACTVAGLVVGATVTVAAGKTFRSGPAQGVSPAQVIAAPPVLTPAPTLPRAPTLPQAPPATQAAPSRPEQQSRVAPKKAPTSGSDGAPKPSLLAQGPVKDLHIWLTGYSFQDNTPPSSAIVSAPILHKTAGGTGTYTDPITVAVPGHAGDGDMAWKGGTRFYLPTVRRYVIVEDSGASPAPSGQDGHLDMWVDGQGGSKSVSDSCMDKITGTGIPAIMNPPPGKPIMVGPITSNNTCHIPAGTGNN